MSALSIKNTLSKLQPTDRPKSGVASGEPYIACIYGFAGREHMQRNLLRYLRSTGYTNTVMYGHLQAQQIADDLQAAAAKNQDIVIIGYSQGGLEAARVANELDKRGVGIELLITIAAGGAGRLLPHRWFDNPRIIPANVACALNYFSVGDILGSDKLFENNLALGASEQQHIENIAFPKEERVSHLAITKFYPEPSRHVHVNTELVQRIHKELFAIRAAAAV